MPGSSPVANKGDPLRLLARTITLSTLSLALLAAPGFAQDVEELKAKRDKKLQEDWFTSNPWTSDYDEARKRAKESGKVIFAYFTRSYSY